MSFAVGRLVLRPLARSFATTSTCRNQSPPEALTYVPRKSRTPKVNPKAQSLLSPDKLRALVSLYHQSEDFITEENLLNHIDAAFLVDDSQRRGSLIYLESKRFEETLKKQRDAPRIAPWYHEGTSPDQREQFSGQQNGREKQIVDALYGVESGSLPGYETLLEAKKMKMKP